MRERLDAGCSRESLCATEMEATCWWGCCQTDGAQHVYAALTDILQAVVRLDIQVDTRLLAMKLGNPEDETKATETCDKFNTRA